MKRTKTLKVPGFAASAVKAGIKKKGGLDMGLILAPRPCPAAGIFTRNRVKAPSIILCKRRMRAKGGKAQAVLVNSGNANACVGKRGMDDSVALTGALAKELGLRPAGVLMNSTGVIGEPLPLQRMLSSIPRLAGKARPEGLSEFARAIMTTDTYPKTCTRRISSRGSSVTILAAAKGAGMVMPDMATMLAYVLTDAEMERGDLQRTLAQAAKDSFNALTIDGDTSTSDCVLMLASGESRKSPASSKRGMKDFQKALSEVCLEISSMIAADGEGATKMFKVTVKGARTVKEADAAARRVANSPLVKTAIHAGDPNWGRVMAALGSSGAPVDPEKMDVHFISKNGAKASVVKAGAVASAYSEKRAKTILSGTEFTILIRLGRGKQSRTIYTCDLSPDYVKINAAYRT